MPFLTYDGTSMDHEDTPQELRRGEDGRPIRSAVVKAAKRKFIPIEVRKLWNMEFPAGIPVEVSESHPIVKKAKAMGCFKVTESAPVVAKKAGPAVKPEAVEVNSGPAPLDMGASEEPKSEPMETKAEDQPTGFFTKKRGRPKKSAEE